MWNDVSLLPWTKQLIVDRDSFKRASFLFHIKFGVKIVNRLLVAQLHNSPYVIPRDVGVDLAEFMTLKSLS